MTADSSGGTDRGLDVLAVLEAMLFVSPEPLTIEEIGGALPQFADGEIEAGLDALARALEKSGRGLRLEKIAGGYRLVTRPELAEHLRALFRFRNRKRLTPATLDVLAIVAYAQPITAPEIQAIRGTDPAYGLGVLQERKLIRVVGRKRVVGRPMLYGTTREFLVHFGLDTLEDLPPVEAYGTQVIPSQRRLFPVTDDGGQVEELDPAESELDGLDDVEHEDEGPPRDHAPAGDPPLESATGEAAGDRLAPQAAGVSARPSDWSTGG